MRRWARWAVALALAMTGFDVLPGEPPHPSLVPWKIAEPGDDPHSPLVLFWIPASRDEVRHSDLLTSDELTLYSSQCVAMRVVRSDDIALLEKLGVEGALPAAVLMDGAGKVLARVEAEQGVLVLDEVEELVHDELDRRITEADALLDDAREKADSGAIDDAVALYRTVWEKRCTCPRQARDAQRALKKLKAR